jgi:hypothetical protein
MTNGAIFLILRNNTPYDVIVVFHFFATPFNAVSPSIRIAFAQRPRLVAEATAIGYSLQSQIPGHKILSQ